MSTEPNVKSFSVNDAHGKTVRLTISTDIVDYMASAHVFGKEDLAQPGAHGRFQKRLIAIPDRKTEVVAPMVLSIGSNNGLYLVRKSEGSKGEGWTLTDLGASFEKLGVKGAKVRAVGAAWTDDDRIAVAVALDDGANSPSRVLVAYDLNSKTDFDKVAWTDCGTRAGVVVHGIRVLAEEDRSWTVVLDGDAGRVDMLYLLRSKRPAAFAQALVFNPAVDYQEIFDFEVAVDPITGSGIAVLGASGNKSVLSFRPFPEYNSEGVPSVPPVVPLPCPEGAKVIESGVTRDGGTDLYIGGAGVHVIAAAEFDNQDEAKVSPVASAEAAGGVEELSVADAADGSIAVWAKKQDGGLVMVKRAAGDAQWSTPLRLREGVQAIAPVQGDKRVTTSLLLVYTSGQAAFLLRDAATGTWRETPLLVGNPKEFAKVTCYGTTVRVIDDGGLPRVNVPVKVSASALANVALNSENVSIGPGLEVSTKTDGNGGVHVYDRVRSMTPAVYRITLDGFAGSFDVNPAGGIYERLSKVSAEELRKATVPVRGGGTAPLLSQEFLAGGARSAELDGMAQAMSQAASLASKTANGTTTGATKTQTGSPFSSALRLDSVPSGYAWGIQAGANGVALASPALIQSLSGAAQSVANFFSDLGDTIADLFESVKARIKEGWTFVVRKAEQAFEFICELGGKIKKFVLTTLEQIGSFFTWLWEEVKTGLEKVWEYLKFVFDWNDILIARDVMVKATDEALKYVKSSLAPLKEKSNAGFDHLISEVNRWRTEMGVPPAKLPPPKPGESFSDQFKTVTAGAQELLDKATGNSAVNWVYEKMNSMFDEVVHIEGPNPATLAVDAATGFLTGVAGDTLNNLEKSWNQIQADIGKIFSDMPEAKDLSFETIKHLIVVVGGEAVVAILKILRDLVGRAIDLLVQIIDVIHAMMFSKISFPFIEKLVEFVAPGTKLDTGFRVIDAMMLLAAVPATITYKLIYQEAPFKKDEVVNFGYGRVGVQGWDEFVTTLKGFKPFALIGVGVIKTVKVIYGTAKAAAGEFGTTIWALLAGVAFGVAGVVGEIVGRHEKEGDVVTVLEWVSVGASIAMVATSAALLIPKFKNPIGEVIPNSHRVEAGVEVFFTFAQVVVGAVAFGFIVDNIGKAVHKFDKHRTLPETFGWMKNLFDQAGDICVSTATLLPMAAAPAKVILLGCGAIGKGTAAAYKTLDVASRKIILDKFVAPA